jgi:glutaredoxin 2
MDLLCLRPAYLRQTLNNKDAHETLSCPFCVRADMVANYKQVEHEKVYLPNDDEATCLELIGAKRVPILQLEDGSRMGESLDIAQKLDELGSPRAGHPP